MSRPICVAMAIQAADLTCAVIQIPRMTYKSDKSLISKENL